MCLAERRFEHTIFWRIKPIFGTENFSSYMGDPTAKIDYYNYPYIKEYSQSEGIAEEVLAHAFEVEQQYHKLLLKEGNFDQRQALYTEFYAKLLSIYGRHEELNPRINPKDKTVNLFAKELEHKSIIDFGCGQGYMLRSIAKKLDVKDLTGIDVYIPEGLKSDKRIDFIASNVVKYVAKEPFDIAISDNVLEHLVQEDAKMHIDGIFRSLKKGGKLIVVIPNRLFGPSDITRIKDFSHSGNHVSEGGHVNESTYTEMIDILKVAGFKRFSTVLPIPKFKYTFLRKVRVGTGWIKNIENSPSLLSIFRAFKIKGVCPIRFTVTLIAEK